MRRCHSPDDAADVVAETVTLLIAPAKGDPAPNPDDHRRPG
ncbi:MAG TPA: hypothetical protein VGD71_31030 [Kribbella sp.]